MPPALWEALGSDLLCAGERRFISSWNQCLWIFLKRKINQFYHNIAIFLNDRTSIFIHLALAGCESIGIMSFSLNLLMFWHHPLASLKLRWGGCSEPWGWGGSDSPLVSLPSFFSVYTPSTSSVFKSPNKPGLPVLSWTRASWEDPEKYHEVKTRGGICLSPVPAWVKCLEAELTWKKDAWELSL